MLYALPATILFARINSTTFISVGSKTPVIATTSKLLSTGADCKMTKLIVLDEWINSMTEFKQIIGRGTRIREKDGKTYFIVMDIRGVTALFADPDWDGPIEIDEDYGRKSMVLAPVLLDLNQIPTLTQLIHHIHQKKSPLLMKMGVVSA